MTGTELILATICNASFCDNAFNQVFTNAGATAQISAKETELQRLKNELNGKHIKVATYNDYPMSWTEREENGTLVGHGVAFVLMTILQQRFNFTFEIVLPERNIVFDRKSELSLIGLVNSSKVDMAAAFIPTFLKYKNMVKFSLELDEGVWLMMLKRPKESAAGSGLLAPFATYVWYLILAAVICYGPCITFLTWLRAKLIQDNEKYIALSPSVWFVYGAFIKQGTTLAPDANTTRVLFATWWLFVILLSAFYTANLTAFLTLSKFTLDIEKPEDLYKKNYRWVAPEGGPVYNIIENPEENLYYLSKMVANGRAQFKFVNKDEDYLPMVNGGAVLVKEQAAIYTLMYEDYLKKTKEGVAESDKCPYVVATYPFMKEQRAFAYPQNSTLRVLFDRVLFYLTQSGIVKFLQLKDLPSARICPLDLQSKDRQLRNSDLMMTYVIMMTGLAAAIAVFVGEICFKRRFSMSTNFQDRDVGISPRKPKKQRIKALRLRNYYDTNPPPYDSLFGNSKYKFNSNSERRIINGREYYVAHTTNGDIRLIPVRTPSAFLYQ
ncbi:glutamate receptor ionotropic, delta-2 [Melitaea cinxia]|uniref:glutamate receptor ionotropic, delta-2 n=1 Tax=Melitaea cinxia TaxID=113334 RepID=UPI001E273CFD|nr:glutamate receptor ionotropic, delta-2 [Melitaea cinxia]